MLQSGPELNKAGSIKTSIPQKLKFNYSDFREVDSCNFYVTFEAKNRKDDQIYSIRVLDLDSDFVHQSYSFAASLFIKENLYLAARIGDPSALMIEDFTMEDKLLAFVYKPLVPFSTLVEQSKVDVEKMLKDLLKEVDYLYERIEPTVEIRLDASSITVWKNKFMLTGWNGLYGDISPINSNSLLPKGQKHKAQSIFEVAKLAGKLYRGDEQELTDLKTMKAQRSHGLLLNSIIESLTADEEMKELLKKLLSIDETVRLSALDKLKGETEAAPQQQTSLICSSISN